MNRVLFVPVTDCFSLMPIHRPIETLAFGSLQRRQDNTDVFRNLSPTAAISGGWHTWMYCKLHVSIIA